MASIKRNEATVDQIRALEDGTTNPLTGAEWPAGHTEILQGRRKLPVYGCFDKVLKAYHDKQVLILSSETGSDKSTQVPQALVYDEFQSGLLVACTQPRRLAATTLAKRVSEEMGVTLGEEVGYQIGGDKTINRNGKKTRLAYMTEGVLLGNQNRDKNFSEFACIIIDEAHERTIETDLLLAMLKRALHRRKDLKVVIMSATVDAVKFQKYFNDCPVVKVPGRNFKVEVRRLAPKKACVDFRVAAASMALHFHRTERPGHILIFLPGQGEIELVCSMIRGAAKDMEVFPLYSGLPSEQQKLALAPSSGRKCIVATNIAETSLTIDGVVYVIDSGLSRQMTYNYRLGMHVLSIAPISQASARQRMGRAGRTQDGVCQQLYTKEAFERMPASTTPTIRLVSVHSAILRLLYSGIPKPIDFNWLDAPHPEGFSCAAQDLETWEFIKDGALTPSGAMAAAFSLDPIWFRAVQVADKLGCSMDMLDIAVLCSSQRPIFKTVPAARLVSGVVKGSFACGPSDHLALANAFNQYVRVSDDTGEGAELSAWCNLRFLDEAALKEARTTRDKLGAYLAEAKFKPSRASPRNLAIVRQALAIAFCTQTAIWHADGDEYRTVHTNTSARLETTSSIIQWDSEWVVYNELYKAGGRVYLKIVTPIEPEWLVDLPYFQNLPLKEDGTVRQPKVKQSLDDAKARIPGTTK